MAAMSVNGKLREYLMSQGHTGSNIDMMRGHLQSLGYTGISLSGQLKEVGGLVKFLHDIGVQPKVHLGGVPHGPTYHKQDVVVMGMAVLLTVTYAEDIYVNSMAVLIN